MRFFKHDIGIKITVLENGDLRPSVILQDTFMNELIRSLQAYWRWCAEGRPPYQHEAHVPNDTRDSTPPPLTPQYYYDNYHNAITWVQPKVLKQPKWIHGKPQLDVSEGYYRYSIQTSDSPDGDDWARGAFRLVNTYDGMTLELFKETDEQLKN